MSKRLHTICEEHNYPLDANGECFFCAEEQEKRMQEEFDNNFPSLDENLRSLNFFMPTKFVVLWLQTVFIRHEYKANPQDNHETTETVLQSENFSTLEESWKFYNTKAADDTVQQVMILVPLKDFNRSK